jgi:CDP-glucose 4,6-dehydratase
MISFKHSLTEAFFQKKVFVTGHTGFKGGWLCQFLADMDAKITGFSLPDLPTYPNLYSQLGLSREITDIRGDIRDPDAIAEAILDTQPDFVFHLAAQPIVRFSYTQPLETYQANVLGTIHVLEALRKLEKPCTAILITTDKCYENLEWLHGYREEDALGGYDPYSSSKAACEIAIASWRRSFFSNHPVRIASARAGNVIGGGDWAADRIVPDIARSHKKPDPLIVRNPAATRPWQHVLEPVGGYLALAAKISDTYKPIFPDRKSASTSAIAALLSSGKQSAASFNFGPNLDSNRTVLDVVKEMNKYLKFEYEIVPNPNAPHEAGKLNLATDKAFHLLGWKPRWDFRETIAHTADWYRENALSGLPMAKDIRLVTRSQISSYMEKLDELQLVE